MESKTRFIQDRTITMLITSSSGSATINLPFAVDRIRFKYVGTNHNSTDLLTHLMET